MAGTVVSHVQLGDDATATDNFTLTAAAADGTMKLARGNFGATTEDNITVAADGHVELKKTTATSMVRLHTSNGSGSTNTMFRRFTTTVTSQGTDITYADSATLGGSFTINTDGVYAVTYTDVWGAASTSGISLNSSQGTTAILSITTADRLVESTSTTGFTQSCTWTGFLSSGDVIRAHESGSTESASTQYANFTIVRVS